VTSADEAGATASPGNRRVDWIELFFDLAFVAFITQLAHGLHGAPGPTEFLAFVAWSVPAWWAWTNIMIVVNLVPTLPARFVGISLLLAMGLVGLMAASVTEGTGRAWAFSIACAGLRVILLVLWVYRRKKAGLTLWRPLIYNGATAVIWVCSIFTPVPFDFALWAIAILIEVLLIRVVPLTMTDAVGIDVSHASERLGLFMIILMGESVLSLVTSLGEHWTIESAFAALLGFAAICALAWGFFVVGTGVIEQGLERLNASRDFRGLLDTVMILPYLLVVGVTMFAAGLATAVSEPLHTLSWGAAISLGGGTALFYLTDTIVSMRYGDSLRRVARWAVPGIVVPLVLIFVAPHIAAVASLAVVMVLNAGIVVESMAVAKARARVEARASRSLP
jgi:low temperature requirement protein LtrA